VSHDLPLTLPFGGRSQASITVAHTMMQPAGIFIDAQTCSEISFLSSACPSWFRSVVCGFDMLQLLAGLHLVIPSYIFVNTTIISEMVLLSLKSPTRLSTYLLNEIGARITTCF
jgi:hypothetical protein